MLGKDGRAGRQDVHLSWLLAVQAIECWGRRFPGQELYWLLGKRVVRDWLPLRAARVASTSAAAAQLAEASEDRFGRTSQRHGEARR